MIGALRAVWRGVMQFEHYGWLLVLANILTVALSLPIVTAPAAFAALSHLSNTAQSTPTAVMSDYWEGFRASFWRGLLIGLLNVIVIVILVVNFRSYELQSSIFFVVLRLSWLIMLGAWLLVQLYLWPLLDELIAPTLRGGLRNAAVMLVLNPIFSLTLAAVLIILMAFSTVFAAPWVLITLSLIVSIANAAVLDRLNKARAGGQIRAEP